MTIERKRNNVIGLGLGIVIALIFIVSLTDVGLTGERDGGGVALPKHYPHKFAVIGRIDRIAGDEIVVNDSLYRLSPDTKYHTPTAMNVSNVSFHVGSHVGFLANSEKEIIFLWLLK